MTSRGATLLTFHGLAVLFLGLVAGAPYGAAIVGGWGDEPVRAWKLAHMEGVQNGILLVALAGVSRFVVLGARAESVVVWGAALAAWGNVVGATLGALTGYRGLAPEGPLANWLVFVAFMFGMWGVLIAVPVAAWGALARLRARDDATDTEPARRASAR
jgi:hypothetical protein